MSKAEVSGIGNKWYRVAVTFSPAETAGLPADVLRYAGARLRYAADGTLTAFFELQVDNPRDGASLVHLLACFGENGYFDEGQNVRHFFKYSSEPEAVMEQGEKQIDADLRAWPGQLRDIATRCMEEKRGRVETLRAVRAALGAVAESEIRYAVAEALRRRYHSEIFCATVLRRLGWPDTRRTAATPAALRKIS